MSHAAVDGQLLFWFVVTLTLLLLVLVSVMVWTHPGAADPSQSRELDLPAPLPRPDSLPPVRRPPAVVPAGAAVRAANAGHRPSRIGSPDPAPAAVCLRPVVGGPPWSPAPRPPGLVCLDARQPFAGFGQGRPREPVAYRALQPNISLLPHTRSTFHPAGRISPDPNHRRSARIVPGRAASGGRAGAHRRVSRRGAHPAGVHRRVSRRGAHRAGRVSGRAAGSAVRAGRHRR